jgi:hypothetical protein
MLNTIRIANKRDKKNIVRFYKRQHYSASFIGYDQTFIIECEGYIIASVIISQLTQSQHLCNSDHFLHALVVDIQHQRKALATSLLTHVNEIFTQLYCFADINLEELYCRANFKNISPSELPEQLASRYWRYQKNNRTLCCFKKVTTNQA